MITVTKNYSFYHVGIRLRFKRYFCIDTCWYTLKNTTVSRVYVKSGCGPGRDLPFFSLHPVFLSLLLSSALFFFLSPHISSHVIFFFPSPSSFLFVFPFAGFHLNWQEESLSYIKLVGLLKIYCNGYMTYQCFLEILMRVADLRGYSLNFK